MTLSPEELAERLRKARENQVSEPAKKPHEDGGAKGIQLAIDIVAPLAVGFGLGWAFDNYVGTKPIGIILGLFLGVGAGLLNFYRSAMGIGPSDTYAKLRDKDGVERQKNEDR
jgi:ATP synthase protein I